MTGKRFTWLKKDVYAPQIVITDSLTEEDLTPTDCYELLNELAEENEQLKSGYAVAKDNITELRRLKLENKQLKKENKKLKEELDYYKNQCIDENVEWLRNNTVWEQMPSKIRTHTKTSIRDDLND